ncbi:hypothetical protein F5B22DRAFT_644613 [Xylaria bambusicola]|uniref:uncharacterized protein n=1 Tax=Xylaria bambusicola TaxID=326684 RepID=UPI0020077A5F|nr:uncharacterized protein F5B22DRAFT_644613 [Xylaria bambusicola]KAI0520870.1 hypothetical protein F5B22DRAFT_644613 [Xylaria bambusicola]
MPLATSITPDDVSAPVEPPPPKRGSTSLDPIVLDEDGSEDDKTKKWIPSLKRRRVSPNPDNPFTPPRAFTDILQNESADADTARLDDKLAKLQEELSKLESERLENTRLTEDMTTLSNTLAATKSSFEEQKRKLEGSERDVERLNKELNCVKLEVTQATNTRDTLEQEVATQRQLVQKKDAEIAMTKKEVQRIKKQASLSTRNLKTARAERAKSDEELMALREKMSQTSQNLSTLQADNEKLVASTNAESRKAKENARRLELSLEGKQKDYEIAQLEKSRLQEDSAAQIGELSRRIQDLESKGREDAADIQKMTAELAIVRLQVSKLEAAELDLQLAAQRIEELEVHIDGCPIATKTQEEWDEINKEIEEMCRRGEAERLRREFAEREALA